MYKVSCLVGWKSSPKSGSVLSEDLAWSGTPESFLSSIFCVSWARRTPRVAFQCSLSVMRSEKYTPKLFDVV